MGVWMNWSLIACAVAFVIGDLVLEVYAGSNFAVLGMIMLAGGILGLGIDSAAVGLGSVFVMVMVYMAVNRRPGILLPTRVSGN